MDKIIYYNLKRNKFVALKYKHVKNSRILKPYFYSINHDTQQSLALVGRFVKKRVKKHTHTLILWSVSLIFGLDFFGYLS